MSGQIRKLAEWRRGGGPLGARAGKVGRASGGRGGNNEKEAEGEVGRWARADKGRRAKGEGGRNRQVDNDILKGYHRAREDKAEEEVE